MERIPQSSIFITLDVHFLYTNIPNNEGIKAVEAILKWKTIATEIITIFLHLDLTLNNFIFNCQKYTWLCYGNKMCSKLREYIWINSNKESNFLDTVVYKTPTGKLETKLYQKDTGRKAYLHRKSEHPRSWKRKIPFKQILRDIYVQLIKNFS